MQDFTGVMKRPGLVGLGAVLQYTIMPFMGFATSRLAGVSPPIAVGWAPKPCRPVAVLTKLQCLECYNSMLLAERCPLRHGSFIIDSSQKLVCRLCLVACCPGGVASNVVTFLAGADVPLSGLAVRSTF